MEQDRDQNYNPNQDQFDGANQQSGRNHNVGNTASSIRGDDGYNPQHLAEAEQASNPSANNASNLDGDNLSQTEDAAASAPWDNQTGQGGTHASRNQATQNGNFKNYFNNIAKKFKGKGPAVAITGVMGGGALIIGLISAAMMSLLPIHVAELFKNGMANMRNPMMTVGVQKTVSSKLADSYSTGLCKTSLSVKCRFKTASDKTVEKLTKNGVKVNIDGKSSFRGRNIVTSYEIDGKTISNPKEMMKAFNSDPSVRSKMDLTFKTRLMTFADTRFHSLLSQLGLDKNPLKSLTDKADAKVQDIKDAMKSKMNQQYDNFKGTKAGSAISEMGNSDVMKKAKKAMRGVNSAVELYCGTTALARIVSTGVKAARYAALASFAVSFLSLADKIKAGDASPEEVQYLGEALTDKAPLTAYANSNGAQSSNYDYEEDEDGNKISETDTSGAKITQLDNTAKSATESQFYNWYAYGDASTNLDSSAANFTIGAGVSALLATVTQASGANMPVIKRGCKVVNSVAYDIFDTIRDFVENVSVVGLVWNVTIGVGVAVGAGIALQKAMDIMEKQVIPDDISGQDYGNALSSGAGALLSENARAGGGAPLTKEDAIVYNQESKRILAMQAEEDRLEKSPFDPTSRNTFLGSIVFASLPMITSNGMLSSLGAFGNITARSFSSILPGASAVDDAKYRAGLDTCSDGFYEDNGFSAGPDCNLQMGIPVGILTADEDTIFDTLISEGQIKSELDDENASLEDAIISGSDLAKYKEYCTDRSPASIGDEADDGGFFGLTGGDGWSTGTNCLHKPDGNNQQKLAGYYAAFINLSYAEDSLDNEPESSSTSASDSDNSVSGGVPEDAEKLAVEYTNTFLTAGTSARANWTRQAGYDFIGLAEQCYALSMYYAYKVSGGKVSNPGGNGWEFANNIVSQPGWEKTGPEPGSIFSIRGGASPNFTGTWAGVGHTGVVISIEGDKMITAQANIPKGLPGELSWRPFPPGNGVGVWEVPISQAQSEGWVFATYKGGS